MVKQNLKAKRRKRISKKIMQVVKLVLIIINLLVVCFPAQVLANSFGETCETMPMSDPTGYLVKETAYGFIQENIDIKTHTENGCQQEGEEFQFCIKNATGVNPVCNQVTLALGDRTAIRNLTDNPEIVDSEFLGNVLLSVDRMENKLCLFMPTSRGLMPLMCRNSEVTGEDTVNEDPVCRALGDGCYEEESKSQSLFSFSGVTVHCLRDTLDKVFYTENECIEPEDEITFTMLRPFPEFQKTLNRAVRAALILYITFFGFKLAMNYEVATPNEIFLFLMKFILVLYFSVGIWGGEPVNGVEVQRSGVTDFVLPMFVDMTARFTEFIFLAAGSNGLCDFDSSKYEAGYSFYKVWDAIDCRIGFYLGMNAMHNIGAESFNAAGNLFSNPGDGAKILILNQFDNFALLTVIFGFLLSGGIFVIIILLIFMVVFISVIMYFITAYLVCMVTLYVMAYIAPIFVPMALFHRTKSYFDAWLKILVACTLQPAIIGGFLALLLTVFDTAMYGTCEFNRVDYEVLGNQFSTFQIALPSGDVAQCESSVGYKLLRYFSGEGWENISLVLFEVPRIVEYHSIMNSLVYLLLYIALFYYFIKSANAFASRLVGAPDLSSVTVNPNMIVDKIVDIAKAAAGLVTAAGRLAVGDLDGAIGDTFRSVGQAVRDSSSNTQRKDDADGGKLVGSGDTGGDGKSSDIQHQKKDGLTDKKLSDVLKSLGD